MSTTLPSAYARPAQRLYSSLNYALRLPYEEFSRLGWDFSNVNGSPDRLHDTDRICLFFILDFSSHHVNFGLETYTPGPSDADLDFVYRIFVASRLPRDAMETNSVTDLYQRYKIGTKHVVQWLADTAQRTCDLAYVLPSTQAHPPGAIHSKPKKKKNKKRTAVTQLTLSTQDLLRLANAIASTAIASKPAPDGIETTISVLRDVINGRSECTSWYRNQAQEDSVAAAENDERHCYFVDVLRDVLEILKQTLHASQRKPSRKKKDVQAAEDTAIADEALSNAFASLYVHEPAPMEVESTEPSRINAIAATANHTLHCELEKSAEDAIFALWCVLKQCYDVRLLIRGVWRQWREGQISLPTAGEVTDKAFMLIHIAFLKLTEDFPEISTFDDVSKKLQLRVASTDGALESFSCDAGRFKNSTTGDTPPDELLCIPALSCLSVMRAWVSSMMRIVRRGGADGVLEVTEDAVSHVLAGHRLGRTIMLHWSEILEFKLRRGLLEDFMGCDVFVNDLLSFFDTQRLLLPFVVEFQIYMDLYDEIETTGARLYWAARYYADHITEVYEEYTEALVKLSGVSTVIDPPKASDSQEAILRSVKKAIDTPISHNPDARLQGQEDDESDESYISLILLDFPVMTGFLLSSLAKLRYLDGVDVCNNNDVVVAAAHLYRACRSSGTLQQPWEDMEFVIAQQSTRQLGLRETSSPTPALTAAKHYGIAFGVELREYAKRSRGMARDMAKGGWYGISRVPLPATTTSAYRKRAAIMSITEPYMLMLAQNTAKRKSIGAAAWEAQHTTLHQLAHMLLSQESQDVCPELRTQWRKCHSLTPVQLLDVFKSALVASEPAVNFNYHLLYAQCAVILDSVRTGTLGISRKTHIWYGLDAPNDQTPLHQIVDEVLWKAAEEEMIPRRAEDGETTLQYTSTYFTVMFDAGKGAQYCRYAAQLSSGTLAGFFVPRERDDEDPMGLRRKPEHLSGAKVLISGTDLQLTRPERDPRWTAWRAKMDEVDKIVEAQGGDKLSRKELKRLMKKAMEEHGVKRSYNDEGDDSSDEEESA